MDKLFQYSILRINSVNTNFKRYLWGKINWHNRLIAITGARGVGKTTMLLQYIKLNLNHVPNEVVFVNLDDLYFSKNSVVDFASEFVKRGGKYLFLDEVHKYANWSQEVKNIYDYFGELKIVLTGSSALNIYEGTADLSRRAILYKMHGLSFREFVELKYNIKFPVLDLDLVLNEASVSVKGILQKIKPIKLFEEYIQKGYYPFFIENEEDFYERLKQVVNHVLDRDLPSVEKIDFKAVQSLRKLLSILAEIVPYKPNILKLSEKVGVSRETLIKYLYLLARADLLVLLQSGAFGIARMNKPEKVYLNNPNLMFALTDTSINSGALRETFIFNQLMENYGVAYTNKGDFLVDNKYTIEVGGKGKNKKQKVDVENAFIAADNIEYAHLNKIPLWLFGFLY
jgi:predicted AAA+ superfamily ATPase